MSEERREYFRIDDEVALDYRLISEAEAERLREKSSRAWWTGLQRRPVSPRPPGK